jgi:Asp-tRNA(Asn)/Glu-tRNA(Gln) amidotransferase A subunit family amidase
MLAQMKNGGDDDDSLFDLVWLIRSFDIAGRVTGFGNPDWARTHAPAAATSPVVLAALAAGATSLGTTIMDEMAYR